MTSKEWKNYKFSELVYILGGGTPKTTVSEYWNGTIPWLSVKDFNSGEKFVYTTEKTITQLGLEKSSTQLLKKNDIILSARGTVGEIAVIPFLMAFNQSCYGIRAKEEIINSDFLYYLLKNSINLLKHNTHGSVFDTITRETFDNIEIKLPPLKNQQKIAKVLSVIDDKIELNNSINNNLEQQAQAIFKSWFVDFEPFGGTMPNDWEISKVENAVTFSQGVQVPVAQQSTTKENDYVQFIRIIDLTQQNTDIRYIPSCNRGNIDYDDIFMIRYGSPGILGRNCRGIIANNLFKIEPKIGLTKNYLFNYFNSSKIQDYIKQNAISSTMPAINFSTLYGKEIIIPTVDIIEKFTRIDEIFRLKLLNINIENQKLIQLRDTLLPKLMNGEIDVSKV